MSVVHNNPPPVFGNCQTNTQLNLAFGILTNLTRTEQETLELVGKTLPDEAVKEIDVDGLDKMDRPMMELLLDQLLNRELSRICQIILHTNRWSGTPHGS